MLVFLYHSSNFHYVDNMFFKMGHEAVIIFFVMSGFIIAFCYDTKEKSFSQYLINRASRIYSVVIPALLLTAFFDYLGSSISPQSYGDHFDLLAVRFISSLLFTNALWMVSIQSLSNVPYWSINYEVWYYLMFAALFYFGKYRWLIFAITVMICGIKILMLAPCWWIGVWIYRSNPLKDCSRNTNLSLFLFSIAAFCYFVSADISQYGWSLFASWLEPEQFKQFAFSRRFITDYLLMLIVALNFASARVLFTHVQIADSRTVKFIRYIANFTFALYLLHQPLLTFFQALLAHTALTEGIALLVMMLATFTLVIAIGHPIEQTKHIYRKFFNWLYEKLQRKRNAKLAS